jgi:hypothetical protein
MDVGTHDVDESHVVEGVPGEGVGGDGFGGAGVDEDLQLVLEMWESAIHEHVQVPDDPMPAPIRKQAKTKPHATASVDPKVQAPASDAGSASVAASMKRAGTKAPPTATCFFASGRIDYHDSTLNLQATCMNPLHGVRCILTRRGKLGKSKDPKDRRSLGLMGAFLECSNDFAGKDAHMAHVAILSKASSHEARLLARTRLFLEEGGGDLAHFEREPFELEAEEPVECR